MPELKKPFGMLIRLQDAIDFDAIDGKTLFSCFSSRPPPKTVRSMCSQASHGN
jgi:hypothetical protein